MSSLLDLPDELIVRTATYIDITDVCSLRQVCKRCFLLSHEREIWESILQSQANRYPLPRGLGNTTTSLEGQMKNPEELAISVHVTANSWRRHRGPALHFETQAIQSRDHIRHMHMILDRWLLVVSNKSYEVWDLYPSEEDPAYMIGLPTNWARGQMKPTCRLRKGPLGHIWSFVACADLSGDAIILAITCSPLDQNKTTTVQRLTFTSNVTELQLLGSVSDGPSRHPVVIDSNSYLAAIDSSSQLVAFKTDLRGNLLLWHWPTNSYWRAQPESTAADAQLRGIVVAVHFLTPRHLIVLRARTVDLLTLDFLDEVSQDNNLLRADVMQFRGRRTVPRISVTFSDIPLPSNDVFLSEPQTVYSEGSKTVTSTFLSYSDDGLFHYAIEAQFLLPSETLSSMVPLARDDSTILPLNINVTLLAEYLTTCPMLYGCALGSQGKRGVWFEQSWDNDNIICISGFAVDEHQPKVRLETTRSTIPAKNIQGWCLLETKDGGNESFLGETVTECAFSEITGTVVLGTYKNELLMLYPCPEDRGVPHRGQFWAQF